MTPSNMTVPYSSASHLQNAALIGDEFETTGLTYCADDNTYEEYTYTRKALACEVNLCSRLTSARPLTETEIFDMMFNN